MPGILRTGAAKIKRRFSFRFHLSRRTRLVTIAVASILVVAGVAYGGYRFVQYRNRVIDERHTRQAEQKLENTYFSNRGNQELKVAYVKAVNEGDTARAAKLYAQAAGAASTDLQRALVYQEYFRVATLMNQYQQAKEAAVAYVKLYPGIETYELVAGACERAGDKACQIEYLKKEYEALDPSQKTGEGSVGQEIAQQLGGLGEKI